MRRAICKYMSLVCVLVAFVRGLRRVLCRSVPLSSRRLLLIQGNRCNYPSPCEYKPFASTWSPSSTPCRCFVCDDSSPTIQLLAVQLATGETGPKHLSATMTTQSSKNVVIEKVTDTYGVSDGPYWDNRIQKLYFVDIYSQYIRSLNPATGVVTSAYIEHGPVGVVIPVADTADQLIVGSGKDVLLVTWNGNNDESDVPVKVLCSLDSLEAQTRTNDGKVDSAGRLWLGTMAKEVNKMVAPNQGTLYRIDNDCKLEKEISPVSISNGLVWNSEDDTFYYIDSPTRQVAAYDYEPNNGTITNKRIVFDLNQTNFEGMPDGMTIDSDDNLWIALLGGYCVIHVDPRIGKVLQEIKLPVKNVTSVTFGDPLLDTLYVTTWGFDLTAEERKATPDAGAVFAVKNLGVRGVPSNLFVKMD